MSAPTPPVGHFSKRVRLEARVIVKQLLHDNARRLAATVAPGQRGPLSTEMRAVAARVLVTRPFGAPPSRWYDEARERAADYLNERFA